MNFNKLVYRIIVVTFIIASLSLFGSGCGSSSGGNTSTSPIPMPTPDPTPSTGGDILYSKDIQPIFNANCAIPSCHGTNPPSGLKLTSYADFVKGGVSGKPFVAGDSANSLIIKRLEGTIAPSMPRGGEPLNPGQIQKVKSWIDAGGKDN